MANTIDLMVINRSIPRAPVIPELAYPDIGEAITRLCGDFGFTLRLRIANHRAQLNVADGAVVLIEADPAAPMRASVLVRVDDVDAHYERVRLGSARILDAPETYPYGERQYNVEDFAGHRWCFSESIYDADPLDWGGTPVAL